MTDEFWRQLPAILIGVGTLATALGTIWASLRLGKVQAEQKIADEKLDVIHNTTNSLSDKRAHEAEDKGHAAGVTEGTQAQKTAQIAVDAAGAAGRAEGAATEIARSSTDK